MTVASSLLAGAATVDITPAGSVFLFGYPHVRRMSTGVHDPLTCSALFLRSAEGVALFLALDLIFLPRDFVREVRGRIAAACRVPPEAILLAATHTHSGPVVVDQVSSGADPVVPRADPAYCAFLADQIVKAAVAAMGRAEPAELAITVARADGVGTNRHDPTAAADPEVPVLLARAIQSGQVLACMLVHAMHPTVLHEDSTLLSADFPHFTRQWLRAHALPPGCVILFVQGASGNQSPRHTVRANTFAEAQRLGELLARAIGEVIPSVVYAPSVPIAVTGSAVQLEPRIFPPIADALEAVRAAKARFQHLKRTGAFRQIVRTAECDIFGAEETAELARAASDGRLPAAIASCSPAEIQSIRLGRWNLVAWPGEFFVEYGLELKARAPGTILITLANGELQGYIATDEADRRGCYEARNAVFAPVNGRRFIEATLALLKAEGGRAA